MKTGEIESQIEILDRKKAEARGVGDTARQKLSELQEARGHLLVETALGRRGGPDVDGQIAAAEKEISNSVHLVAAVDVELTNLRTELQREEARAATAAWPGLCAEQKRDIAAYLEARAKLFALAGAINARAFSAGKLWRAIRFAVTDLGEREVELPTFPNVNWNDAQSIVTPEQLSRVK